MEHHIDRRTTLFRCSLSVFVPSPWSPTVTRRVADDFLYFVLRWLQSIGIYNSVLPLSVQKTVVYQFLHNCSVDGLPHEIAYPISRLSAIIKRDWDRKYLSKSHRNLRRRIIPSMPSLNGHAEDDDDGGLCLDLHSSPPPSPEPQGILLIPTTPRLDLLRPLRQLLPTPCPPVIFAPFSSSPAPAWYAPGP
jgi:hypothetical protein